MLIERQSPLTGKFTTLDLPVTEAQLLEMKRPAHERRYVQDIFPDLTMDQREFIKTGYTPEDWTEMFPPEKDPEPYTVIYTVPGDILWRFYECEAEDGDHAEELLDDAHPGAECLWVNTGHGPDSQHMGSMED